MDWKKFCIQITSAARWVVKILEGFSECPESLDYWNLVNNSIVDTDSYCVYGFFFDR